MLFLGQMGENTGPHKVYAAFFEIFIFCRFLAIFWPFLAKMAKTLPKNGQKTAKNENFKNRRIYFVETHILSHLTQQQHPKSSRYLKLALFIIFKNKILHVSKSHTFPYIFAKPYQLRDTIE